ncbi:MAG: nitroreductase family protein [Candidatus Omnitrophica bacterium]|nr:nitroreductase family protein [Candidatus Omnitrophota bacterium]
MDTFEAIKTRRSVRVFKDKAIPNDILEKLVDAGRFAATARNVQPWKFVIVTDKVTLRKLAELAENGRFISGSAACIAVFCEETKYYLEDGCAATQNILVAACAEKIGSCWVAGEKKPYAQAVSKLLGAPNKLKLISMIALGYPEEADALKVADKISLKELIHWEKF